MSKVLIVGAGGVGGVVVHKCAQLPEIFSEIVLASRTESKCHLIASQLSCTIKTAQVNANNLEALIALIRQERPQLIINAALPYQNLTIMDACLEMGVHYIDTACFEVLEAAKFEYAQQWAYREKFKKAGLIALLGAGFDPGVTNVYTAYLKKHYFDEIHTLDIIDCNAGDHGLSFATNFNSEINIREVTANGRYWEAGQWKEIAPLSVSQEFEFPDGIGSKKIYMMYHEELESITTFFPEIKRARFWMTFSDSYLMHLRALENVGLTSIKPVIFNGQEIIPLQFLQSLLPDPSSLGSLTKGKTCIGCFATGIKNGQEKTLFIYNVCDHQESYREVQSQAISYTTGVPAMIAAKMILERKWQEAGVWNLEQLDPDAFMQDLNQYGLPWQVISVDPMMIQG